MLRRVENALIRRARDGDEAAVETLIRAHQEGLYAFILRISGRPDVAEDVVQDAFVRVLRNIDRFDSRFRFSTWLFTIAKRLYMNHAQKLGPLYDSGAVDKRASAAVEPGRAAAKSEILRNAAQLVDSAVEALPQPQREIVELYHRWNRPIAEIAGRLGMPVGTVKSHLHRGRSRMRRHITADRRASLHAQETWT